MFWKYYTANNQTLVENIFKYVMKVLSPVGGNATICGCPPYTQGNLVDTVWIEIIMVLYHYYAKINIKQYSCRFYDNNINVIHSMAVLYACRKGTTDYVSLCGYNNVSSILCMLYIVTVMTAYDKFHWGNCVNSTQWTINNGLNPNKRT